MTSDIDWGRGLHGKQVNHDQFALDGRIIRLARLQEVDGWAERGIGEKAPVPVPLSADFDHGKPGWRLPLATTASRLENKVMLGIVEIPERFARSDYVMETDTALIADLSRQTLFLAGWSVASNSNPEISIIVRAGESSGTMSSSTVRSACS